MRILHVAEVVQPSIVIIVLDAHLVAWAGKALEHRVSRRAVVSKETLRALSGHRVDGSHQWIEVDTARVVLSVVQLTRFTRKLLADLLLSRARMNTVACLTASSTDLTVVSARCARLGALTGSTCGCLSRVG